MNGNHIDCDKAKDWLLDTKEGELSSDEKHLLDQHIAQCLGCQEELAVITELRQWLKTDQPPEPSPDMHTKFFEMLYQEGQEPLSLPAKSTKDSKRISGPVFWLQIAASIFLLFTGVTAGYWLRSVAAGEVSQQQIDTMAMQVQEMRQIMMMTLLENPSAAERLHAVSISTEIDQADDQVFTALLTTLNYDSNTNVRLAALEALIRYTDNPKVRKGLIHSLPHQESPVVQMALADLMVKLQEKGSVKALRELLHQKGIRGPVKEKVKKSILQLS
ncbi:HEAT repeat domain-containing protein [Dyadobacter sp. CY345]|uniref:HEAT repeat domain-containing protein n=1 Tax=Dyadobacter sp. CY345 TaxID=2909335 RepID=UPI001F209F52|nr:HEAT repeat domain-containing protein [Dyadobacter sp. CY345]MCF2446984.1 HEAT repeat domain-containing protein [Dyadobacter sp. CY345]